MPSNRIKKLHVIKYLLERIYSHPKRIKKQNKIERTKEKVFFFFWPSILEKKGEKEKTRNKS